MENVLFRKMLEEDYPSVKKIYLEGIATGNATFQTDVQIGKIGISLI
jgi:L-amino acid N-acyltransferase YncA